MMDEAAGRAQSSMARRGLLAGAAALLAGMWARLMEQPVQAANGDTLTAGGAFTETSAFILTNTGTGQSGIFTGGADSEGVGVVVPSFEPGVAPGAFWLRKIR